jgi:Domain of unknown function (DUF929)
MKRRRLIRRVTILVSVAVVLGSLAVGIYILSTAGHSNIDSQIGQPVSSSVMNMLFQDSLQPYGPGAPSSMAGTVQGTGGAPYTSTGKPIVVYVGADYCPYCAIQRWGIILALLRFGNFSGLHYMASAVGDVAPGDYATFTFVGSTYTSKYIQFSPFEAYDRNRNALQSVPSNYSSSWQSVASGGIPFMNFNNLYTAETLIGTPQILAGKNWTQIATEVSVSDSTGQLIRESANLITAVICKLTNDQPLQVCSAFPIASEVSALAAPSASGLLTAPQSMLLAPASSVVWHDPQERGILKNGL